MAKITTVAGKFAWSLILLAIGLIVLFVVLAWLHNTFGSNVIGQFAGAVGSRASGSAEGF